MASKQANSETWKQAKKSQTGKKERHSRSQSTIGGMIVVTGRTKTCGRGTSSELKIRSRGRSGLVERVFSL
jgi:hypothetical protein